MSLRLPAFPYNGAKVKKFGFYAPKTANIDKVNGGRRTKTLTSSFSLNAGSSSEIDSFTWETVLGGGVFVEFNKVYCARGYLYLQVIVDGNVEGEVAIPTSQSTIRVVIPNGKVGYGSYTISVKVVNKGSDSDTLYVDETNGSLLEIIYGLIIDQTSETTIASLSLPSYTLIDQGNGDFKYEVGVYVKAQAIRRTTTNANMNSDKIKIKVFNNDYSTILSTTDIPSGNDTSEINIHLAFKYPSNGILNLTGWVGATGDIVIITHLYYQITLIANQSTAHMTIWNLVSLVKGVHYIKARVVAFTGLQTKVEVGTDDDKLEARIMVYNGSYSSEAVTYLSMPNMSQLYVYAGLSVELKGMISFLDVIVVE